MAQSAGESRKTPLSIELLWIWPTSGPPIRWEKWRIQVKLAIRVREKITLDTLLQQKPTNVRLPVKPKYELAIEDATGDTERDRKIRNNTLKLQWELKCQKKRRQAFCVENDHGIYVTKNVFHSCISVSEQREDVF